MGGLIGRLLTVNGSPALRDAMQCSAGRIFNHRQPLQHELDRVASFRANPSIRRVITIATPHQGSSYANRFTRRLARAAVSLPARAFGHLKILAGREAEEWIAEDWPLPLTSVDSLSPGSPVLRALRRAPKADHVTYHNIIGVRKNLIGQLTDGVVTFGSAQLDQAASEIVVPAKHSRVHRHGTATREVHRILMEHLRQMADWPPGCGDRTDKNRVSTSGLNLGPCGN